MKRLLVLFLAIFILTGCAAQTPEDTTTDYTVTADTAAAEDTGLYEKDSLAEQQTNGAVKAYLLEAGTYTDLLSMGDRLLLVAADGTLTTLQGEYCQVAATGDIGADGSDLDLCTGEKGIGYYVEQTREVVILDTQLQQTQRVQLPEQIQGKPVILLGSNEIFYCVDSEIRAMSIQTGISRLVRSHSCTQQELLGSYFDDTILGCRIVDSQGLESVLYLYAENGQVVTSDKSLGCLQTYGADYFALRTDGEEQQILFGTGDGQTMRLHVYSENLTAALPLGGAVNYSAGEQGMYLEFYDFATGKRSAEVTIPGVDTPTAMVADEDYLWILANRKLYRWDVSASLIAEETVYTDKLYTAESPDTEGLAKCQARAEELQQQYHAAIHIWEDADIAVEGYSFVLEYRVDVINDTLDRLEAVMAQMPDGFLENTVPLQVYLVRSIQGEKQSLQDWVGGECRIVITSENAEEAFLQGLGCGVDSHVLGNSRQFDTWDDLNPRGFDYTYDYAENTQREDPESYLEGDSRAFVDLTSMSYPTEDRSRIFAAAVLDGNEEVFASNTMQKKLLRLCEGIREAYDLEDSTEIFPWEQYLNEPLAKEA